ncbi:DUF1572 family protein [Dyadobacter bucti]|uniref:DUF1572 family protein n=1 Tax=Dyadobacter bucti TaxID=2572203 RepID=UPI001107F019|nr:DUF1572 family protein [Dyadobacter bucti]
MTSEEFQTLYSRDLKKLHAEIAQYASDDQLWKVLPGTINSGGNLCQHLIGNLRTYVGLALGNFPYIRNRDSEFADRIFTQTELLEQIVLLQQIVADSIAKMTPEALVSDYPRSVLDMFPQQTISFILTHILAHLSYHSGQINYHRRWITGGTGNSQ